MTYAVSELAEFWNFGRVNASEWPDFLEKNRPKWRKYLNAFQPEEILCQNIEIICKKVTKYGVNWHDKAKTFRSNENLAQFGTDVMIFNYFRRKFLQKIGSFISKQS
jgi:hypothetical protein